ncbi:MAG: hypothetical protein ACOX52_12625 [Verrucomicrobiota bacterium]
MPICPICRNRNRNRSLFRYASGPHGPLQPPAGLCQHRNNTVALPGFSGPNPIPRPFDTETDSDPDPDYPFLHLRMRFSALRMGRTPAEGAGWESRYTGAVFCNCLRLLETGYLKKFPNG